MSVVHICFISILCAGPGRSAHPCCNALQQGSGRPLAEAAAAAPVDVPVVRGGRHSSCRVSCRCVFVCDAGPLGKINGTEKWF
jgi:hypothetical protein